MRDSFFFGYGAKIRGLRQEDVDAHAIDLGDSALTDCLAVDGEDLARELTAVVDARQLRLVWSFVPSADGRSSAPIDEAVAAEWVRSLVTVLVPLFPWVEFPASAAASG